VLAIFEPLSKCPKLLSSFSFPRPQ